MTTPSTLKIVPNRSRNQLRTEAFMLRKSLGLTKELAFPIIDFLELVLPNIDPEFQLEVVPDDELQGRSAETIPDQHKIVVKESVYKAACSGHYYARSVMAHELGHYLLHRSEDVRYAAPAPGEKIPAECNPERQADIFAEELLAPVNLINVTDSNDYLISKHFGVTRKMAKSQLRRAQNLHRAKQRKIEKRRKRKAAELHTQPQIP